MAAETWRKRKQPHYVSQLVTEDIVLVGLTGFAVLAIIPGFLADIAPALYPIRYTLPAAAIFVPAAAALVTRRMRAWPASTQIAIGVLCVGVLLPDLVSYALPLRHPFTHAQKWFERNIPDNSVLWIDSIDPYNSLSRYDRGYRGQKDYVGLYAPDNMITTSELRDSVEYMYLRAEDEALWPRAQGWQGLDQMTRIKTFSGPQYTTPHLSIYVPYLLPNSQQTAFILGDMQLVLRGIETSADANTVTVESYWQATPAQPTIDYSYSLYITPIDEPTNVIAQRDGGLGQRSTSTWDDAEEILRGEIHAITEIPEGEYSVWLILYDSRTGERFVLENGETTIKLDEVRF